MNRFRFLRRRARAAVLALGAVLALFAGLPFAAAPARAALIVQTYDFVATDFVAVGPDDPLSYTSVSGTFSVSFDTASGQIFGQAFAFDAYSGAIGAMGIDYNVPHPGRVQIGGTLSGIGSLTPGANDVFLAVTLVNPLDPQLDAFIFTDASSAEGVWFANSRTISVASAVAVPAPGAVALLGLSLAALGCTRRRRA